MKFGLYAAAALIASFSFVSCTKTNNIPPPKNPIVGLWVGTYSYTDNANGNEFYYSLDLFSDSTVINQGGGTNGVLFMAKGTWSLASDSTVTVNIHSVDYSQGTWTQKLTGKYSAVTGTISNGVWMYTSGGSATGTFSLKRTGEY